MQTVKKRDVEKLLGKRIYAMKKDGTMVTGKLVHVKGNQLYLTPLKKSKNVRTSAIIPLVLFDLLAVGTYGGGYGGFGGYGGYGYPGAYGGYGGYPGYIW
ncbi:50S ribosomal protein L33 [Paenibacillus thalictri]|uniref:50S ribosomal protein L33 n=1 Tax=Paenibacillus thalictri TaxID=2527873 RepID=A0A4Q9DDR8_9BACL|nr:50S ribosomal protein L33 [Paenibacillus thalictri]TBL69325.1 50S ribosomal protein L33 [Paenibacillus thalictri]